MALASATGMSPRYHGNCFLRLPGDASALHGAEEQWLEDSKHQTGNEKYQLEPSTALRTGCRGNGLSIGDLHSSLQTRKGRLVSNPTHHPVDEMFALGSAGAP